MTVKRSGAGDALFEAAMKGVAPLKKPVPVPAAEAQQKAIKAKNKAAAAKQPMRSANGTEVEEKPEATLPPGAAGLDKRQYERLRRGQMRIEGRLDLHGLHQVPAHTALHAFITESYARDRRCVLVITGKGEAKGQAVAGAIMPERERGVLRRNVPRWLNDVGLRDKVLSVSEAQPRHGGAGALYVLLRKRR